MILLKKIISFRHKRFAAFALLLLAGYLCLLCGQLFDVPYSTVLEDSEGTLLGAKTAADGQWRFPPCREVPPKVAQALVEFEDRRFAYHPGVDVCAIVRAAVHNIRAGKVVEGGSTIHTQVIRLMRKNKPRTFVEKVVEAVLATRLEIKLSKKEILALYASHAPFGGNVVGIDAAAWRYFGRSAQQLSWAEAAMLAVLPNSPSIIHPAKNRTLLLNKRNKLLDKLFAKRLLSEEDLALAKSEPLPQKPLPLPMLAPHLLNTLTATHAEPRLQVTLNAALQQAVTQIVNAYISNYQSNRICNAAAVIMEVESGKVLAYVGNALDLNDEAHGSNVDIVQAYRSTGSILKPFLYAAMLSDGVILPRTLVPDYPFYTTGFAPSNFSKTFDGAVPAREALARSLNVPAVRMLRSYSTEKLHHLLKQLGMSSLAMPPDHYGLSLVLGGAEVNLWTITGMYAYLARMLNHYAPLSDFYDVNDLHAPIILTKNLLHKPKPRLEPHAPLSAAAVWATIDALEEVNRPEEEATWSSFSSGRRVAWKTGTSYGHRDAWAVGITPQYAIGVWVGNASGEGRPMLTGVNYAAPILFDLFRLVPNNGRWFDVPYDDMVREAVCRQSGHRASAVCTEVDTLWLPAQGAATAVCPYHTLLNLDAAGQFRVNSSCYAVSDMQQRAWFVLPPAQEYYYKQRHHTYQPLPPLHPHCATADGQRPIDIIYPVDNTTILLPRQLDGAEGLSIFRAAHRNEQATLFWHIDNEYVGATQGTHRLALHPAVGAHTLTLVDHEGHSVMVRFEVRE
ncbi:penicillin-binding protein 1C [Bacteroidia bacterium]|nr:penicillin-binding protein 1C [Bacteroidia bacterium]